MTKKKVAIVKLQSDHDIRWNLPWIMKLFLGKKFKKVNGKPFMPQVTPYYLAALGMEHGNGEYEFEVLDALPEDIEASDKYDMAWFTTMTPTAPQVYAKADEFRRIGVKVVLGGIHPSMMFEEAKQHADSVATGEGEVTIPQILYDFSNGGLKKKYKGGISKKLDKMPYPAWELADGRYAPWIIPFQTSRGCGNACEYCSTTRFQGGKRRHRPIEDIIGELEHYIEKGSLTEEEAIFFTDNNSVADTDHRKGIFDTRYSKSLFRAMAGLRKRTGVYFSWIGQGEINMADDLELMELLAKSGCITQLIGYESFSKDNLTNHSKVSNNPKRYAEQTETLHKYGIQIIGCFIVGLPKDGPEVFDNTYSFIRDSQIDVPQISVPTPFPGTSLCRKANKKGLVIKPEDWSKYDITHLVMKPECSNGNGGVMSAERLEHEYLNLYRKVYTLPAMLSRAFKAAFRKSEHNPRKRISKFISVLAPNIIYRGLGRIGR